jgi:hypothetical protein
MRSLLNLLVLSAVFVSNSALGSTVLIDFGRNDNVAPSPYNEVTYPAAGGSATTGAVPLFDTGGGATGWSITVTDTGSGNGGNAGAGADVSTFPAPLSGYSVLALADSMYGNDGGGTTPGMAVTIGGLNASAAYDLLFYGSRANGQSARLCF